MKKNPIMKPVGLETPCKEIETICSQALMYKRCGLRPPHLILPLDAGSGRTTFLEYMADRFREAGVIPFSSGFEDYLEICLDGTLPQLRQAFAAIDAAAVYTNFYQNIVGMDISLLALHLGESQLAEFLKNSKRICEYACGVFFVQSEPSRNEERLLEKLCETVGHIKRLTVEPYRKEDLCQIIQKVLGDRGIEIRQEVLFRQALWDVVSEFAVLHVREAVDLAASLVPFADFSGFIPTVDENSLKAMAESWRRFGERREMK